MVLLISNQSVEDPGAVLRPTLGLMEGNNNNGARKRRPEEQSR